MLGKALLLAALLFAPVSAEAAAAFVQKVPAGGTMTCGGGVDNRTLAITPTAVNNLLVVAVTTWEANGDKTLTVSDPTNGTYTNAFFQATGVDLDDYQQTGVAWVLTSTTSALTITVNPSGASADMCVAVAEFSGIAAADTQDAVTSQASSVNNSTVANSGTITTTQNDTLLIAAEGHGASGTVSENQGAQGYTLLNESQSGSSAEPGSWVYRIQASTCSAACGHTWTIPSDEWAAGVVAFKATGGGGGAARKAGRFGLMGVGHGAPR
jgi:hypothetical protein